LYQQELEDPKNFFDINPDGRLVMHSEMAARWFAAGFSLLPTEHWVHPVHRLQLQLLQAATKAAIVEESPHEGGMHPRDMMYGVDSDFNPSFQTWPLLFLNDTMKRMAYDQRKIFTTARRSDLGRVFMGIQDGEWQFPEFPDPLTSYSWQSREYGAPYPANIIIEEVEGKPENGMRATQRGLEVTLPPLKARAIDPPIRMEDGSVKRLSEVDPSYGPYLAGQRAVMAKAYVATVLMRPDIAERMVAQAAEADKEWPEMVARMRDPRDLVKKINDSEAYAAAMRFDDIREV
jgi:hypothetical protein